MSIAELRKLPAAEKLRIIETLWEDIVNDQAAFSGPTWHAQELDKTESAFKAGQMESMDWEAAKKELQKRFE